VASETILIVDDGQDNREFIIEYVLKPHGFKYLTARDGEEGLRMALKHDPDLILLDLQMPRLNGIQVLEQLYDNNREIPVILMTFHGSEEIAIEVYRMGVKDYIKKPYYPEEMLDAIERALGETRLRREKDALTNRVLQANQELQRRLQEFEVLYNIGKMVTSNMNLEKLLPQVVDAAVQITNAEEGTVTLIESKQLICRAHKPPNMTRAISSQLPIQDKFIAHAIRNRESLTLGPEQLRRGTQALNAPKSLACAPLVIGDRVLGAITVTNHSSDATLFDKQDTIMLNALGDYIAIAIENSRNYHALRVEREKVQDTFERFVAPSVVHRALTDDVKPGGIRQEITVLFADIRGYTTFSETASPEKVLDVLNHYLSVAGEAIMGFEGTLDKFLGDGIMAIFNAPNPQEDHVLRAAEAAITLREAVNGINAAYGYKLAYSVGLHVGEAVVGYVGTSYAVNYTAIGDTVNLAKRLQENAAPNQILADESVINRLGDLAKSRALGYLQVKGRKTPVSAYELLEVRSSSS
jgi:class 3 adenylate cyclase/DNA-binding response OmpR family regulator